MHNLYLIEHSSLILDKFYKCFLFRIFGHGASFCSCSMDIDVKRHGEVGTGGERESV